MTTAETHGAYRAEYARIKDPALQRRLHALAHSPRIPAGIARAWALALLRWRAGDRPSYPVAPSATVPLATIQTIDTVVRELHPTFTAPGTRPTEDLEPHTDTRAGDWNPHR